MLNHAVSEGLDRFYRQAADAEKLRALGRPEADVTQWPNEKDFSGDLRVTVEVDVRPEFTLPNYDGLKLEVDAGRGDRRMTSRTSWRTCAPASARSSPSTARPRPATSSSSTSSRRSATNEVDTANNISYELGSGELIEGIDEALDTLTAGETTTFESRAARRRPRGRERRRSP